MRVKSGFLEERGGGAGGAKPEGQVWQAPGGLEGEGGVSPARSRGGRADLPARVPAAGGADEPAECDPSSRRPPQPGAAAGGALLSSVPPFCHFASLHVHAGNVF